MFQSYYGGLEVHLLFCFLAFSHQPFQASVLFSTWTVIPLLEEEMKLVALIFVKCQERKKVGQ